ncbi:MAG: ABC transporter ATP-binding protein [Blastopirellula sp.]|nr:MAG: ABC transporter ATP-binding protein [Blastopirellula sp.]
MINQPTIKTEPVTAEVQCSIRPSFRVAQVAGMFDLPQQEVSHESFSVELPVKDGPWQIGIIVGPSGSGKSTIARHRFADSYVHQQPWPADQAIIDGLGNHPIKKLYSTLTSVGLSSPPVWLKPYQVLSGGEQFRANLARALLSKKSTIVFDEFTSTVDRTSAQIGSAAIAKAIRRESSSRKFIAVTCHYDVIPWLEPDWVVDMADQSFTRRCLRRPQIELEFCRAKPAIWAQFARHHYLNAKHLPVAQFYVALFNQQPVAVVALVGLWGKKGHKRVARVVVLPDYQGIGIGSRTLDHVCSLEKANGFGLHLTAAHPGILQHCKSSPLWQTKKVYRGSQKKRQFKNGKEVKSALGRQVASFQYVGPAYA